MTKTKRRKLVRKPLATKPLVRFVENLELVLDYWLEQAFHGSWPSEVVVATCELMWPGRTFRPSNEDDGMCYIGDALDAETGESAADLFERDRRATQALKR
jgi:hypothetical protein